MAAKSDTADRAMVITRMYDAPRELVWAAWTDADRLAQWWGPDGFRTTTYKMDFRVGGAWVFAMHGPDGTDYPNFTRYLTIEPPSRLVYEHGSDETAPPSFTTTVTFETVGNKTKVTMRALFPTAEALEFVVKNFNAIEGGNQTLGRLDGYLQQTIVMRVSRHFAFPAEQVFDAWLDARGARTWWFKTPSGEMQTCEIVPRVGGTFRIVEKRGDMLADHFGTFVELDRPRRIVFDFATDREQKPTRVTIEIAAVPGGCELTLWHAMDRQWADFIDRTRNGWTMILDNLAQGLRPAHPFLP